MTYNREYNKKKNKRKLKYSLNTSYTHLLHAKLVILEKLLVTSQTHPQGRYLEMLTDGLRERGGGGGSGCKRRLISGLLGTRN